MSVPPFLARLFARAFALFLGSTLLPFLFAGIGKRIGLIVLDTTHVGIVVQVVHTCTAVIVADVVAGVEFSDAPSYVLETVRAIPIALEKTEYLELGQCFG